MGWQPDLQTEGAIYAKDIQREKPGARIALLYQNDDYGKDYRKGFRDALGDRADKMIVGEASYESTDPTVDSQIVTLQASGADTFFNVSSPKFAAQAIRKAYDIGWKPRQYLTSGSSSVAAGLQPARLEKSTGIISAGYIKEPTAIQWPKDQSYKEWLDLRKKDNAHAASGENRSQFAGARRHPRARCHPPHGRSVLHLSAGSVGRGGNSHRATGSQRSGPRSRPRCRSQSAAHGHVVLGAKCRQTVA